MEVKGKDGKVIAKGDIVRYQHYDELDKGTSFKSGTIQKFIVRFESGDEADLDTVTKVTSGGTRRRSRGTRRRRR